MDVCTLKCLACLSELIETEGVDHITKEIYEFDFSPLPLKGLSCLSNLSGSAFHTFAKDIFNRAQRDFYFKFNSCLQQIHLSL